MTLREIEAYVGRFRRWLTRPPRVAWFAGPPEIPGDYWIVTKGRRGAFPAALVLREGGLMLVPMATSGFGGAGFWLAPAVGDFVAHAPMVAPRPPGPRTHLRTREDVEVLERESAAIHAEAERIMRGGER